MLESKFKANLIKDIEDLFPGCIIIHLDPNEIQGFPDLLILYKKRWGALEGKKYRGARRRPNQDYYIDLMNEMSFAAFIYPENKEEILDGLQSALRPSRPTRLSKCQ